MSNNKLKFGDEKIIEKHREIESFMVGHPIEGVIHHHGEYGSSIHFECLICGKCLQIELRGENSKTECCKIIYNKKYKYGREIYYEGKSLELKANSLTLF